MVSVGRRAAGAIRIVTGHPEEGNAEALPRVLAWQQQALPAGEFRPVTRVLLPLHGGKARPQEDSMLAILGVQWSMPS